MAKAPIDDLRASKTTDLVEQDGHDSLIYYVFPDIRWKNIRINSPPERITKEIRGGTRVVGAFQKKQLYLNLAAAKLR